MRDVGPIWTELYGGLWHTTHPERFLSIMQRRAILVEPDIPDSARWCTMNGRRNYPFARYIGGLSLFDFANFDPAEYEERCPASSWRTFVPYRRNWGGAVWIQVDRSRIDLDAFVSGPALRDRWYNGGDLAHNLMPYIEAAHLGDLPVSACSRALFIHSGEKFFEQFPLDPFDKTSYTELLTAWNSAVAHRLEHRAGGGDGTLSDLVQRDAARRALAALRKRPSDTASE